MNQQCIDSRIRIKELGSFFAGGQVVTLTGQPQHSMQVARNAPERIVDLNGDYITGQCYVQYVRQSNPAFDVPIMFWHGGAMTGATWETTPDQRPGWQNFFLNRGADTYVCDAMERGRAGWSPHPEIYPNPPIFRTLNEAWTLFRFGDANGYSTVDSSRIPFDGLLFPLSHFDDFAAQIVPRWTDHSEQTLAAYYQVLERVGPVVLIAHSQGGNLALEAAANYPEYFKGVVVIEPASAPESSGSAYKVPHLFVWGDNIKYSKTWISYRKAADNYADRLTEQGGIIHVLDLPTIGIQGNSHVPMMDLNSDKIAMYIANWLEQLLVI